MITLLNAYTYQYDILINFIAHSVIFIGAFYSALQNRTLPQWHITSLWYVGLFSLFTVITIVCQWGIGSEYPLSYYNIGRLAETLVHVTVAVIAVILLVTTVQSDMRGRRRRREQQQQ